MQSRLGAAPHRVARHCAERGVKGYKDSIERIIGFDEIVVDAPKPDERAVFDEVVADLDAWR
jgi:hypothetical protein